MPALVLIDARDAFMPQIRGWGRYTRSLVTALRAEPLERLRVEVIARGGWGPEILFEQLKLPLLLRRRRAAVVHAPNCFLPLVRPCPGVVTIHDLAFETWPDDFARITRLKYRQLVPLAARSAQLIICPSLFTRDDVVVRYGIDPGKIRVIPEAPALAGGSLRPPSGPYVLGVGDLRRKKNFGELVAAMAELRERERIPHRLVIAGIEGGEGPRLRELAGGLPLELTGYISDERLDALIRGASVLVHPSLYEGFGLVLLEAMARGTPVLAARATALPETGGAAAAYFEPEVQGSLRDALSSLLADPDARDQLAQRGLERAKQFSWPRVARETAAAYEEVT